MSRTSLENHDDEFSVHAAGGVIWRVHNATIEVVIVHRPKYSDWTFPKGKLDEGEDFHQAAWREVFEETGFDCALGKELKSVAYKDSQGRAKLVRYWAMQLKDSAMQFQPNDEVDRLEWVGLDAAAAMLTYEHDSEVLESLRAVLPPAEA